MYKWLQGGVGLQLVRWWLRPDFFMEEKGSFQSFKNGRCHTYKQQSAFDSIVSLMSESFESLYSVSDTRKSHVKSTMARSSDTAES
jgi:hypothetical protein